MLCLDIVTEVNAAMASAVDAEVTLSGQALAGLRAFCHTLLDDPRRARTLLVEGVGVSAELEQHRRSYMDQSATLLIDYVRALAEANGAPFEEGRRLRTVVRALVGGVGEVLVDWLSDPDPAPLDYVIDDLAGCSWPWARRSTWAASDVRPGDLPVSSRSRSAPRRPPRPREALRTVACYVVGPARRAVDGHIGLQPTPGGFGTPVLGDPPRQVRIEGSSLVVVRDGVDGRVPVTTLEAAAGLVGLELVPDPGVGADLPVFDPVAPLPIDDAAAGSSGPGTPWATRCSPRLAPLFPARCPAACGRALRPGRRPPRR